MIFGQTHVFPLEIEFALLDAGNVVYHPNYLILCERARNAALADAGYSFPEMWRDGYALALFETQSRYQRPALLGEKLAVATKVEHYGRSSLTVRQQLVKWVGSAPSGHLNGFDESAIEEVFYSLTVKLVCVRLNPLKTARIPPRLIEALRVPSSRGEREAPLLT